MAAAPAAPAKGAITAPSPAAPVPERPAPIPRPALENELLEVVRGGGRLLVLAPRRGGARSLARSLATTHFGDRVTWLSPPSVPNCSAEEYFRALSNDPAVDSFLRLETWLHARALSGASI